MSDSAARPQPDPEAFQIPTVAELDAMRADHGLSQQELSRRAGFEASRFNDILHNDYDPQRSTLCAFLGVLQESEPQRPEERSKTGPKPRPSSLIGRDRDGQTGVADDD